MRAAKEPSTELDPRYSSEDAAPTSWAEARDRLAAAEIFWLATVRPEGRPHVTPLIAVWHDGALYFSTGPEERKARNLAANPYCTLTTGSNALGEGMDLVVEGRAAEVHDDARLRQLAEAHEAKYGADWHYDVRDGDFWHRVGGRATVYEVAPVTAYGFARGARYAQTRWRFERGGAG
ncbi:pyridoxamine 5'-phosphate oxidase family protein [Streptomyces violens]|uniref:pyridoxamine 5'-phosphate oxidase family protein n=1 Tax=Streptomyces violens TaxID=66377 RepID=UPI0004C06A23|nr:pyridoxamine 5'-phosphate oxidase family protein [Streptomyces violens]